jgi:hypothetical protein
MAEQWKSWLKQEKAKYLCNDVCVAYRRVAGLSNSRPKQEMAKYIVIMCFYTYRRTYMREIYKSIHVFASAIRFAAGTYVNERNIH